MTIFSLLTLGQVLLSTGFVFSFKNGIPWKIRKFLTSHKDEEKRGWTFETSSKELERITEVIRWKYRQTY